MAHPQQGGRRTWFLNGNLVRVLHRTRAQDLVHLYDYQQRKVIVVPWSEFLRMRKYAYSIGQVCNMVNRKRGYVHNLIWRGELPKPYKSHNMEDPDGDNTRYWLWFDDDLVLFYQQYFANKHMGKPREDGRITNDRTPDVHTVRRQLAGHEVVYTKDKKTGEFVPLWRARDL